MRCYDVHVAIQGSPYNIMLYCATAQQLGDVRVQCVSLLQAIVPSNAACMQN